MNDLVAKLVEELDLRPNAGVQMSVTSASDEWAGAGGLDGLGRPVTTDTLFSIYCAGKPLTAVAIAQLVASGRLRFDQTIASVIDSSRLITVEATIADVLSHNTGTWRYPAVAFVPLDRLTRREHLIEAIARSEAPLQRTYSEFVGWEMLAMVIEQVTGTPFAEHIWEEVILPLELQGSVEIRPEALIERRSDVGVNVTLVDGVAIPLLWEQSEDNLRDATAAMGVFASMAGLARFYRRVAERMSHMPALRELVLPAGAPGHDRVLGRTVQHGHGFMIGMASHGFTGLGDAAFGHTGLSGMTVAAFDPDLDLSVALHVTDSSDELDGTAAESSIAFLRRSRFLQRLTSSMNP